METKIDGGTDGPFLVQTIIGDKETAIMGTWNHVELIPGSKINAYIWYIYYTYVDTYVYVCIYYSHIDTYVYMCVSGIYTIAM